MDIQLKELIETIKKEGVKSAEEQAGQIVAEAEKKSNQIVENAQREAQEIVTKARAEAERSERSGKDALKQAARDLLLNLQGRITKIFDGVVASETASALKGTVLEEAIVALMKSWNGEELGKLDVLLAKKDLDELESSLRSRLADELRKGLEIKPSADAKAGFVISEKDGNAYYNFTSEGIAEILTDYLNPKLAEVIREQGSEA